jgi:hypothetical protein
MDKEESHLAVESPLFDGKPHGWIQWKGTDVCIDLYCECGEHCHYDGDFLYFFICPQCDRLWEVGTHVPIYEVSGAKREEVIKRNNVKRPDLDSDD